MGFGARRAAYSVGAVFAYMTVCLAFIAANRFLYVFSYDDPCVGDENSF